MEDYKEYSLKSTPDLLPEKFLVDTSCTPFKWDSLRVTDFLAEIALAKPRPEDFYILARVIVKKRITNGCTEWELLDGVRRMTTLMLLLLYLDFEQFSLRFQDEEHVSPFLDAINNVKSWQELEEIFKREKEYENDEDFYFRYAFEAIKDWFTYSCCSSKLMLLKLQEKMKIIWMEVPEDTNKDCFCPSNYFLSLPLTGWEIKRSRFYRQ